MPKTVVGWRETVALPDWGIDAIRAKLDTGARSSAIHVENLEELDGCRIKFDVVMDRRHKHKHVPVVANVVRESHVKSSNGEVFHRYFVRTTMVLGPVKKEIEISLANRDSMKVRMLIGRSALGDDFLVDAHSSSLMKGMMS